MADRSRIEWTDATWNPVTGCTRVSEGCRNCYIDRTTPFRTARRRFDSPEIGGTTGVLLHPERLAYPLKWRKPRRVFVNSLADLFHDEVPDEFIGRVFAVMAQAQQHTFQVLTKRPARARALLNSWTPVTGRPPWVFTGPWPLPNVWLGVSTEDQATADRRIPILLDTPAAVRWISAEPLLGPVDVTTWLHDSNCALRSDDVCTCSEPRETRLDWVVVGGESGPGARPMHPQWARTLRDQCAAAGVPFHFKQWGEWGPAPWAVRVCDPKVGWKGTPEELAAAKADAEARGATHAYAEWAHLHDWELYQPHHKPWSLERADDLDGPHAPMRRWGKGKAGRELDGRTHDEYPAGAR